MSQIDLRPVKHSFKEDEIEALHSRKNAYYTSSGKPDVYYYVQWKHGIFLDGWYNYKILNQDTPEVLERQWKKDKAEQCKQNPEIISNASFSKSSVTHTLCEWNCGHHEIEGVDIIRDHAIPQRDMAQVNIVILV